MTFLRWLGRALAGLGRALAAAGRGWWRAMRWSARMVAAGALWVSGRGDGASEPERRRRVLVGRVLVWVIAFACFWIAFATGGTVYDTGRTGLGLMPFVGVVAAVPFGLIATRPLLGLMVSVGGAFALTVTLPTLEPLSPWPWTVIHGLVMLALLFATCAREPFARALGAWLLTASLFWWGLPPDLKAGWVVGVSAVAVAGLLAGRLVRANRQLVRQEEETSAEKARRVVLEERARIARDLHDIVAHHMSLVVVQAETAAYRVPGLSEEAQREFASIGESARSALGETRALLSVLRAEEQAAQTAPQPGLPELLDLVEGARRAGVDVEASIDRELSLRPSDSLAVYRIAQEGVANASRHAAGAPVRLTLDRDDGGVRLVVENGAAPGDRPAGASAAAEIVVGGHGITGMRERAAAAGGTLAVGPGADGGFRVELRLPWSPERPAPRRTTTATAAAGKGGAWAPG